MDEKSSEIDLIMLECLHRCYSVLNTPLQLCDNSPLHSRGGGLANCSVSDKTNYVGVNHQAHVFSYFRPDAGTIETKNVLCSRSRTRVFRDMIVIYRPQPLIWSSIPCKSLELESIPCKSSFYFRPVSVRFCF